MVLTQHTTVNIPIDSILLNGELVMPNDAIGMVIFVHGSGSSRFSPRNKYVAQVLQQANMGTLLFDLLTPEENQDYNMRFNIDLLTKRLIDVTNWYQSQSNGIDLPLNYFGASTGAAAALMAAAALGTTINAIVSRGGRPDLAMAQLNKVCLPTLLIVGGDDDVVIELNQKAYEQLSGEKKLTIIPGATHLFEESGALEKVAELAKDWFVKYGTHYA